MSNDTQTLTLTDFLRARIAEREVYVGHAALRIGSEGAAALSDESAAYRRIVLSAGDLIRAYEQEPETGDQVRDEAILGGVNIYEDVLRWLAWPYRYHPDYREEWRP